MTGVTSIVTPRRLAEECPCCGYALHFFDEDEDEINAPQAPASVCTRRDGTEDELGYGCLVYGMHRIRGGPSTCAAVGGVL